MPYRRFFPELFTDETPGPHVYPQIMNGDLRRQMMAEARVQRDAFLAARGLSVKKKETYILRENTLVIISRAHILNSCLLIGPVRVLKLKAEIEPRYWKARRCEIFEGQEYLVSYTSSQLVIIEDGKVYIWEGLSWVPRPSYKRNGLWRIQWLVYRELHRFGHQGEIPEIRTVNYKGKTAREIVVQPLRDTDWYDDP